MRARVGRGTGNGGLAGRAAAAVGRGAFVLFLL